MTKEDKDIVISLQNLSKDFGKFTAVSDVTMEIPAGEIIGFLGPNGAGKSTTMKMLAGLIAPTNGEILIRTNGELEQLTKRNKDRLLSNMGFLIENPAFYGHMTPRQVLSYFAELKGYPQTQLKARIEEVVELVGLSDWIDKPIKTFSKGMRQKIGIVSALVHDPEILVLDEPQTGLDPKARKEIRELLLKLKAMGKTLFISSHLLYEISEISDKIGIINQGELIAFDTLELLETLVKKSTLQIEFLKKPDDIQHDIEELTSILQPITGTDNGYGTIHYNEKLIAFQVTFDGSPKKQHQILEALHSKGLEIVDFSVPRTNLLESLYINYMIEKKSDG